MKRIICILLVILFCFSLFGCETKEDNTSLENTVYDSSEEENMLIENILYNSNYGDSPETVKKNAKNLKLVEEIKSENYTDSLSFEGKFFNVDSTFIYSFENDKLEYLMVGTIDEKMQNNYEIALEKYNYIVDIFTKLYGDTVDLYGPPLEGFSYWINDKTEIDLYFGDNEDNKNANIVIFFYKNDRNMANELSQDKNISNISFQSQHIFDMIYKNTCYNANYGDSIDDIKSIEGLTFIEETTGILNEPLFLFEGEFFNDNYTFEYKFTHDTLSSLSIFIDGQDAKDKYEYLKEEFTNLYGIPKEIPSSIIKTIEYCWIDDNKNQISLYIVESYDNEYVAYLTFTDLN